MYREPVFRVVGDRGLLVEYGDRIDPEINRKVREMTAALDLRQPPGMIEVIPSYRSIMVMYDPIRIPLRELETYVRSVEGLLGTIEIPEPDMVVIPVHYGGEHGPDIEFVARHNGLSVEDVARLHCAQPYQLYMIGFTPGFAYLGGLPTSLHAPRLETPRSAVPPGSVGIANDQTGIYPVETPGGWRLIGRTPLRLFNPEAANPFLYKAGDFVRFRSISAEEFHELSDRVAC